MKQKFLVFEYFIAILFSLQVLLPQVFTWIISLVTFSLILILKYKCEGLRLTFIIYIILQAGLLYFSYPWTNMVITLITYFMLSYFPVFEFPEVLGPFNVGYKDLTLQKTLKVSVFYPTIESTQPVPYKTLENGWVRIYDIMRSYPGHFIPKFIYKVAFGFLDFLDIGVNLDARIVSPEHLGRTEKFPVIVFSHGLSANRNLYTGFARQWASYGYIVFCIDHDETIFVEFKGWENYREHRKLHLNDRCEAISQVFDFIHDAKSVKKFFQTSKVEIDYKRVSLAGHSFGSAAVEEYNARDSNRITGVLILLDPWLFPASEKALETPANKPVLVLRSEGFANIFEEFKVKERIQTVVESNKAHSDQTISCFFKNTTHNSFCDLIVHMPREMKFFGVIDGPKEVEEVYNSQTMLTQMFLDLMLYPTGLNELDSKKELVFRAFEDYNSMMGGKSKLVIDHF